MHARTFVCVLALLVLGCTPAPVTTNTPQVTQPPTAAPTIAPTPVVETLPATPTPTGFVFEAVDVIAYYQSIGYGCDPAKPSDQAMGYTVTVCRLLDSAGRTRVIGIVTDATGALGNAYAGVWGTATETYLDPKDALDPLAAFLGTMLGAERGAEVAIWMKEHLGEAFATSTSGTITIATYTGAGDDPSELYVEVADPAYLAASPAPSSAP
jgi:hypothetical protein